MAKLKQITTELRALFERALQHCRDNYVMHKIIECNLIEPTPEAEKSYEQRLLEKSPARFEAMLKRRLGALPPPNERVAEIERQLRNDPEYMAEVRAQAEARWKASRTPRQRAQDIKEQSFAQADGFEINEKTLEVRPLFLTEAEKDERLTAQLRAQADAIGERIAKDLMADSVE